MDQGITGLLLAVERGDRTALEALFPLVYDELLVLARRQRRAWHGNLTMDTTALVHEAYLKLVHQGTVGATSRPHFFAVAATAMRHILCNYARDQQRIKRGGEVQHVSLDNVDRTQQPALPDDVTEQLADLDAALQRLEQLDKRQSRIVECRFFAGLSVEETASALGVSPATVKRDWTLARAWLYREMHAAHPMPPQGLSAQ